MLRKIAENIVAISLIIPGLLHLSLVVGLSATGILFLNYDVNSPSVRFELDSKGTIISSTIILVCSLPWLSILFLHISDSVEKTNKEKNPNFLNNIQQKFNGNLKLDEHETQYLLQDIETRIKNNESDISLKKTAFYLLSDIGKLEDFLFHSSDNDFVRILDYFAIVLNREDFLFVKNKVQNRLRKLLKQGVLTEKTIERLGFGYSPKLNNQLPKVLKKPLKKLTHEDILGKTK